VTPTRRTQVLIIGSGAGGATTALTLAERGHHVTVLEEGGAWGLDQYGSDAVTGMQQLYRRRGMTPILGRVPIGYVEGSCLGGSTEINSGFWHRTPRETLLRWKAQYGLDVTPEGLEPHFAWAEQQVKVSLYGKPWPKSTEVFDRGAKKMGWVGQEVPRAAHQCKSNNTCASGCPNDAKQGMSRNILPAAQAAGAKVLTRCEVLRILKKSGRATGVLARLHHPDGSSEHVRIDADAVVICAGPTQTPALLKRSGFSRRVGATLFIHPMLKVVARFAEDINAHKSVLPLLQIKEFWPDISFGGGFFTPGHAAMMLSDNWLTARDELDHLPKLAGFYVAVRGNGHGAVRTSYLSGDAVATYELSKDDVRHLSQGLGRLSTLLLAAGAEVVHSTVQGLAPIKSEVEAAHWLDNVVPAGALSLTTVHAFSTVPAGENESLTAVDSRGRVRGIENVWVNDASTLPDSPGVNPQGTVMALARNNALHLSEVLKS
jgi:choline dehydrogenase-like flavoprotein